MIWNRSDYLELDFYDFINSKVFKDYFERTGKKAIPLFEGKRTNFFNFDYFKGERFSNNGKIYLADLCFAEISRSEYEANIVFGNIEHKVFNVTRRAIIEFKSTVTRDDLPKFMWDQLFCDDQRNGYAAINPSGKILESRYNFSGDLNSISLYSGAPRTAVVRALRRLERKIKHGNTDFKPVKVNHFVKCDGFY